MATTAQCPSCSTRFRVVPDQLKISKGWVRCGKCSEVFDARFSLSGFGPVPDFLRVDPAGADAIPAPNQVSIILRQESEETSEDPLPGSVDVLLDLPDARPESLDHRDSLEPDPVAINAEVQQIADREGPLQTSDATDSDPASKSGFVWALEDVPRSLLQEPEPEPVLESVAESPELATQAAAKPEDELPPSAASQALVSLPDEWRHEVPEPTWESSPSSPLQVDVAQPQRLVLSDRHGAKPFGTWQACGCCCLAWFCRWFWHWPYKCWCKSVTSWRRTGQQAAHG